MNSRKTAGAILGTLGGLTALTAASAEIFYNFAINTKSPIHMSKLNNLVQKATNTSADEEEASAKYSGMTVLDSAVADITTIDAKSNDLVSQGVDCFINLLDNTIVGKLETNILPITNEKSIPVFGSEIEQVKLGCLASASIEYVTVGKSAGKAAAEIIGGKSASDIPVAVITDPTNYYNSEALARFGLSMPQNITAVDVCK